MHTSYVYFFKQTCRSICLLDYQFHSIEFIWFMLDLVIISDTFFYFIYNIKLLVWIEITNIEYIK